MWKYCSVRLQPFALAIDEYLDDSNPLILVSGSLQVSFSTVSLFKPYEDLMLTCLTSLDYGEKLCPPQSTVFEPYRHFLID